MATTSTTKPGSIAETSVLAGRTPSYRLVLKLDSDTGQYKYEYEVDDTPTTANYTPPAAAGITTTGDDSTTSSTEGTGSTQTSGTGSTQTSTEPTSFEQTKAALSGREKREARGRGPEDRGTFQERFGTAEDRGFGFSGGTGTYTRGTPGSDTFTPGPGIGKAYDEYGRLRDIGAIKDIGLNLADTVGKVAKPIQDYVAGGGILGTVTKIADSITGKKDTSKTTPEQGAASDIPAENRFKSFDQTAQALGGTANLGSTRGFFSDLEPARKDIDQQIAELEERAKSPTSPRTFIANEIERLKEQKEKLEPKDTQIDNLQKEKDELTKRSEDTLAPQSYIANRIKEINAEILGLRGSPDIFDPDKQQEAAFGSLTPIKRPRDTQGAISTARQNLESAIQSRDIATAQSAAKALSGSLGQSRDKAQAAMDKAANDASRYNANMTGKEKRGFENSTEVKGIRDKVGQQTVDTGRTVDRSSAVSNKARANEVSDKNGNAVTNNGKAINTKASKYKGLTQKKGAMLTRAEVKQRKAEIDKQKGDKGPKQGRIICSELYRQGLISKEDYVLDLYYTSKHLTEQHTAGYWHFAVPAVKAMRRSKFWTAFWKEIAYNRLQDIKWRLGKGKFNLRGRIYSAVFEPFCYISGYFTPNSNYNELYEGEV